MNDTLQQIWKQIMVGELAKEYAEYAKSEAP